MDFGCLIPYSVDSTAPRSFGQYARNLSKRSVCNGWMPIGDQELSRGRSDICTSHRQTDRFSVPETVRTVAALGVLARKLGDFRHQLLFAFSSRAILDSPPARKSAACNGSIWTCRARHHFRERCGAVRAPEADSWTFILRVAASTQGFTSTETNQPVWVIVPNAVSSFVSTSRRMARITVSLPPIEANGHFH